MTAICNVVVVMTFVARIMGHECNDYHLSPSDQSLVDMMKHYLHTSRKEGCSGKQEDLGVTFIRWGRKSCPNTTELVYTGQAGGNLYSNKGGGANYLCLPNDPDNGKPLPYANDVCLVRNMRSKKSCYNGWHLEYNGILMTEQSTHNVKEYVCVDADAELLDNKSSGNENGALFSVIRTKCGSLRCLPYTDLTEVNCVLCTK